MFKKSMVVFSNIFSSPHPVRILFRAKGVFPFDFFPDEIILDDTKLNVVNRTFFFSAQVRSVTYGDIFNVAVEFGPIFATLEISDKFFVQHPVIIRYLPKKAARKARRIIQGFILLQNKGVDLTALPTRTLLEKAEKLGGAQEFQEI